MFGALLGRAVDERLAGGVAAATAAVLAGASIVRTHDVAATVDAVKSCGRVARRGLSVGRALAEERHRGTKILRNRWRARPRRRASPDGGLRAAARQLGGARARAGGRHRARRQGHAALRLHVRGRARSGLRRRRRQRHADRPAADAGHRLPDASASSATSASSSAPRTTCTTTTASSSSIATARSCRTRSRRASSSISKSRR